MKVRLPLQKVLDSRLVLESIPLVRSRLPESVICAIRPRPYPPLDSLDINEVETPAHALDPRQHLLLTTLTLFSRNRQHQISTRNLARLRIHQIRTPIAPTNRNALAVKLPLQRINTDILALSLETERSLSADPVNV
jgi:hypothetical protein